MSWTNAQLNFTAGVGTVTVLEPGLDTNANVLVVGMYGDNSATYTGVTFGGVAPDGFMNVQSVGSSRMGVAWWINPNPAPGQDIVVNYNSPNAGYLWAFQLSGVNTNVPVLQSGATTTSSKTTSLTTTNYNTLIISFFSSNGNSTGNTLTPNSPLIQCGTTTGNNNIGGSAMAAATNNIFEPGLQTISWNDTIAGQGNLGLAALGFVAGQPGAPGVLASFSPPGIAETYQFTVTATTYPGIGNVTNVNVDLIPIGGTAVNKLVQSDDPNVWTNTFTVPVGAPVGTTALTVTATQDTAPLDGSGYLYLTIVAPDKPSIVQDINPTQSGGGWPMYAGQGVTFSAIFSGPGPITYKWQFSVDSGFSFSDVPGATNNTYTINSFDSADDQYAWRVVAHNMFGDQPSSPVYTILIPGTPKYLWSAPVPFAGLNSDQILTNFSGSYVAGALVARPGGSPIMVTNSDGSVIVFAGSGTWASLSGGAGYGTGANTNDTGNPGFNSCLGATYFDNATHAITMNGLHVGQQYQLQLFALDDRDSLVPPNVERFVRWADPNDPDTDTSQTYTMGDNA
ncbi:MAG TPA: hypothetical protein VFY06_14560, partial [Verrucomicrobiae bacterium]|nr:hypothetical protein [Verrucomicrobiae bacterium]